MFSRLIIATDLSPASFAVVTCLGGLKALGAERCLLLQCLSLHEAASVAFSYTTAFLESTLQQQKEILEKQGYLVETRVIPGSARRQINRIAAEENYSLIVVGSRGHSMLAEAFLGGVASDVIENARRPVLLVRISGSPERGFECADPASFDLKEHVLFPTDFSENADHAFMYVEKLVTGGAKRVTLLHVQDKVRIEPHLKDQLEEFNKIDRARLERMKETLQKKGDAEVDIQLRYGSPFVEITRFIREGNVHLVVMGSQGRGFVQELFLGSVSRNVARHSDAAVLFIPAVRADIQVRAGGRH